MEYVPKLLADSMCTRIYMYVAERTADKTDSSLSKEHPWTSKKIEAI